MLTIYLTALMPLLLLGFLTWLISLKKHDVSIVDSVWSVFFVVAAAIYALNLTMLGSRSLLLWLLLLLWGIRLSVYITWRNWGHAEDSRYQTIRCNNEPYFAWKSLYLVFFLQAILAWIISVPLLFIQSCPLPLQWSDYIGVSLSFFGIIYESIADWQLVRFKSNPANHDKVLNTGLWRYSRHPNYFGEFCVWWGFFILSIASGAWIAIVSPIIISFLLLRISGVPLLEADVKQRRPDYQKYIEKTNAFFPFFKM